MAAQRLDADVPAFHRHVLISPAEGVITVSVEDDYHHMVVRLHHDGAAVLRIEADMIRVPWTTCPGAVEQLRSTFVGVRLCDVASRGEKMHNCTHLHDLVVLAGSHSGDVAPMLYRIVVSDTVDGVRIGEIVRDTALVLRFVERDSLIDGLGDGAPKTLFQLGPWIATLDRAGQEAARLLRLATIIAHGREIPMDRQSDARLMPPTCFTYQDGRKEVAVRIGKRIDFTGAAVPPLQSGSTSRS